MSNFVCSPFAAGNCSMNSSIVAWGVCRFARKEQGVLNRLGQFLFHATASNFSVAIGSAGEWIALPIVTVGMLQQGLEFLDTYSQQTMQSLDCSLRNE